MVSESETLASQQTTIATLTTVVANLTAQVSELVVLKEEHSALLQKQAALTSQCARLEEEGRDARADKAALEQEVRLSGAQRMARRTHFLVVAVPFLTGFMLQQASIILVFVFLAGFYHYGAAQAVVVSTAVLLMSLSVRPTDKYMVALLTFFMMPLGVVSLVLFFSASIAIPLLDATRAAPLAIVYVWDAWFAVALAVFTVVPQFLQREAWGAAASCPLLKQIEITHAYLAKKVGGQGRATAILLTTGAVNYIWAHGVAMADAFELVVPTRVALNRMWILFRVLNMLGALAIAVVAGAILAFGTDEELLPPGVASTDTDAADLEELIAETRGLLTLWLAAGAYMILLYGLVASPPVRQRITAVLSRLGSAGDSGRAATVAALIGSQDPQHALATARRTFLGLPFAELSLEDFASNADTGLNHKAKRCRLGDVSAFLSHSWHDDPAGKWRKLESWATAYNEKHGKRPTVWLDKACLNQLNIEAQLACLPIYLSGCSSLVVLAGATFTERIWCVLEVFTFLRPPPDSN